MTKNYKRFKQIIAIIGALILGLSGCAQPDMETQKEDYQLGFKIKNTIVAETNITSWIDEEGTYHVFLPSYCNMTDVSLKADAMQTVKINDIKLNNHMTMEPFELEQNYTLSINEQSYSIQFHRSANVAALFINTESQSMEAIHKDKDYREPAEATLFTSEGDLNYSTTDCSLKGRGNTTWDYFEKKPYQLKLEEAGNLLEMGEGKKWILLANAFDETNLRNKLVYDLARENELCYAPECEFVDLYLNGEYSGLYLLAERVEFGKDRLNIDADEKYMCNIEYATRWDTLENAFLTDYGRAIEIREPDEPSERDVMRITEIVQNMENAILYPNSDVLLSDVIDIDSWACKYLIDEITENGDADIASSYFYYADGKIYAGPLWDYDNTLAVSTRNQNPYTFLARGGSKSINQDTPYYDALYEQEVFYNRVVELYREKILPAFNKMINTDMFQQEEEISKAASMNRLRWKADFDQRNAAITDAQGLADYLEKRIEFLNSAWIDGEEYCTVQFESYVIDMYATEDTYATSYAVKKGERFSDIPVPKITETENTVWVNSETGEIFDPNQIITENITVLLKRDKN